MPILTSLDSLGFKHALVEFWLRFDTALEDQWHKELEADNVMGTCKP